MHPGHNVITNVDRAPNEAICKQWCPNAATMTLSIFNTRTKNVSEYVVCDKHAKEIARKEYGSYLVLREAPAP